jgi:riboflavin biosynthesis pyrimidine reductase
MRRAPHVTDTFAQFVARKTHEAAKATLPPYVTLTDAHPPSSLGLGNDWSRSLFDGDFYASLSPDPTRPACSLVFVQSRDGNTGARNPSALGGGRTDKHLIYEGLSRVAADAVLAGAETVRGSQMVFSVWHPELVALRRALGKPRHPVQVIATRRGLDIEHGLMFNVPEVRVVLVTAGPWSPGIDRALASRPWIATIRMDPPDDFRGAFAHLRGMGIESVSAVGGRNVATQLIDAGLVQDVYLTTAAVNGGEPGTPLYPRPLGGRTAVRKAGTGTEEGVIFEHLVLERSARSS